MNRPRPPAGQRLAAGQSIQLNPNIVEIFEIPWKEVQMLKDWDIKWDFDPDDMDTS
jgi:hypothetical protein